MSGFGIGLNPVGNVKTVSISDPSVGSQFLTLVPDNKKWKILVLAFVLVNSATAANRNVSLNIQSEDFSSIFTTINIPINQIANEVMEYLFVSNYAISETAFDSNDKIRLPIPSGWIPSKSKISSLITNMQAGDQISSIKITVEELSN